jgi:F-type H+-transporting ATPase subunit alpha
MTVEKQIAIIYCGTKGLLSNVPLSKIKEFEHDFLELMETKNKEILKRLAKGEIDESITSALEKTAAEAASKFSSSK